jgi:hypothetical protein
VAWKWLAELGVLLLLLLLPLLPGVCLGEQCGAVASPCPLRAALSQPPSVKNAESAVGDEHQLIERLLGQNLAAAADGSAVAAAASAQHHAVSAYAGFPACAAAAAAAAVVWTVATAACCLPPAPGLTLTCQPPQVQKRQSQASHRLPWLLILLLLCCCHSHCQPFAYLLLQA